MILVTGGAGFIGSNLIRGLNARGVSSIFVVDNLERGDKFRNLVGARIADYVDKEDFVGMCARHDAVLGRIEAIFHQGACSDTTVHDGRYMMRNNFEASKRVLALAERLRVPLIYASSAAVYGGSNTFKEEPAHEAPLNVYGYSKLLFDDVVRRGTHVPTVGLRYFNVYGPREGHKGVMASVAYHLHNQLRATGEVRLFGEHDGYPAGGQRRDFVYIDDVVAVNLHFLDHPQTAIVNVGTGAARTFDALASAVLGFHGRGTRTFVPFPDHLKGHYQSFTQADLTGLRATGYAASFVPIEEGVPRYLATLA